MRRLVVLLVVAVLASAAQAVASPTLVLSQDQGPSPTTVTATGDGFSPMVEVAFTVGGVAAASTTSDAAGSVEVTLTITGPAGQSVEVMACQADPTGAPCGVMATAAFRVIGPTTTTSTSTTSTTTTTSTTSTTTTTRPPTTTTRPATTTTTQTTLPATTIAPGPVLTTPAVTFTTTTAVPAVVAPGSGDGGSGDSGDSDESGLFWFLLIAGAGVLGWLIWLLLRRGEGHRLQRGRKTREHVVVGSKVKEVVREAGLSDDKPEGLGLGGTGYDGEDGVFVEPTAPLAAGTVFPKVEMQGSAAREGEVIPKLEIGPEATEAKGKGMVEATWKVEEGEKAGPMFPKLDAPAGEAKGKVFPKVEMRGSAAREGEVIPKLEIGPEATEAKGKGMVEATWKVEEGEKAATVFPKVEVDAGTDAEGPVFPKLEIDPGSAPEAAKGGNAETTWKVEKGEKAATVFPKVELDAGGAAEGKVFPKVEVDPGSHGDEDAGTVAFGDGQHGSRPGTADPPPDGDILDHLDDEG